MAELNSFLLNTSLFQGIDENEIHQVLSCLAYTINKYEKNQYVLRIGDSPKSLGVLLKGSLMIIQDDYWGNRNIRSKIIPSQVFAESYACLQGSKMDLSVIAETDSEILWLDVQKILRTCPSLCSHNARLIRNILSDLATHNLLVNEKLTHISKRTTRERILSYLSAESRRQNKNQFFIPFNRQQLADYLSVERSALSAELSRMQKDELLTTEKNYIVLKKSN